MLTILTGIRTIHQDGVSVGVPIGDSALVADMEVITRIGIIHIMAVGITHGTLMEVGVAITADTTTMVDIMVEATTEEVIGVVELLITAIATTADKTIPEMEARML